MSYQMCDVCKGMFEKNGRTKCDNCHDKSEKEFGLVKDYIEKNPNNTVLDIINTTKVPLRTINRFVEDGSVSYRDRVDSKSKS